MTQNSNSISEKELEVKKLEIWIGFIKFILSIFVVGIFAVLINYQIQKKQLELKEKEQQLQLQMKQKEQEQEYLKNFISLALDDNIEKRVRFAQYFSSLLEGKWNTYFKNIKDDYDYDLKQLIEKKNQIKELSKSNKPEDKTIIERLELEISAINRKLQSVHSKELDININDFLK